ncbi:MAG: sulfatase [Halobacteriales archaeon]
MNILLVTVDSLRADRTSLFDHDRDTTPFLSSLAGRSFEFRRAYANGRNTAASFPAIHTSTHQRYYEGIGIPAEGTPTLAEALSKEGYATHAIHTNELVARDYNYDRGFGVYRDARSAGDDPDETSWRSRARDLIGDGAFFEVVKRAHFLSTEHLGVKIFDTADAVSGFEDRIVEWTTEADDDWFVWAHYMNPHHPYEPPADCQEALGLDPVPKREATKLSRKMRLHPDEVTADERETIRGLYDASVLSWDRELERTYEALDDAGELDGTLVVVTADHGELLGEEGRYGHPPVLNQELLRVPLLFHGPVERGMTDDQVDLLNVAPSVLSMANCPIPDGYQGRALFGDQGQFVRPDAVPVLSETGDTDSDLVCCIEGGRKVVYDVRGDAWNSFVLSANAFREEPTDDPHDDLRRRIRDHIKQASERRERGAEVDEEALRGDLAALGYLDE